MKSTLFITVLFVAAAAIVASTTEDVETAWNKFKLDYGKEYTDEHDIRKTIFTDNFNKIAEHNKLYDQGLVKHSLAINKFADMTTEEFTKTFNGYRSGATDSSVAGGVVFVPNKTKDVPDTIDWREKGAVTPVKDQKRCGSCWAFSSTGALEGQYFMKTGKLVSISEQNLVDCSHNGNHGCDGGLMDNAFEYVHKNDGIDSEEAYPYKGRNGKCVYKVSGNVTSTEGLVKIETGNEEHLKAAIATVGPISVAIDASQADFMFYSKGIYFNAKCRNKLKFLDHAVLAVGYGSEDGEDYWLIKNSWATNWGLDGYIKMARNKKNNCGVATAASYPCNYH